MTDYDYNKSKSEISASMMCARLHDIDKIFRTLEENKVEYLHIDVMDGEFVPNFGLGIDFIRGIREMTDIPFDYHLMILKPENKINWFDILPQDHVTIHYESTTDLQRAVNKVIEIGAKPFLALNPETPIFVADSILDSLAGISILTVNPGFAGQRIVPSTVTKTRHMREYLIHQGYPNHKIEVDGNISFENARILSSNGADIFVAGTSSIFNKNDMGYAIRTLRQNIS